MLGINKTATKVEDKNVPIANCPHCDAITVHLYYMKDAKTQALSKWYACSCGIIWQIPYPDFIYDKSYIIPDGKKYIASCKYLVKIITPIIEESMYGRRCLVIGQNLPMIDELRARGWVTYCIDKNISIPTDMRHIQGDFETFQFPEDTKYNLLWLYHTLECFKDPFKALSKANSLLAEDGMLYIGTPDTDFLYTRSPSGFLHWKKDYNHIMWAQRTLTSYLEKLGFNIIVSRKNYEHRLPAQDDCWIVCQRKFY